MEAIAQQLRNLQVGKVLINEPLANHTTMKIGGPADLFIEPTSIENLEKVMNIINKHHLQWTVIGRGSNLLVSDKGIEGAVIKLGKGLDHLEINETEVRAGAGFSLVNLSVQISKKGLAGLEFASGIPGSVGGAVYMNAGAHGSDLSNVLEKVHVLFADGTLAWLSTVEMEF